MWPGAHQGGRTPRLVPYDLTGDVRGPLQPAASVESRSSRGSGCPCPGGADAEVAAGGLRTARLAWAPVDVTIFISACCSAAAMRPGAAAAGPGPAPSGGAPGAWDAALAAYGSRFCMRCLTYGCLTHPGPHPRRGPARRAPAHAGWCQARERAEVSVPAAAQAAKAAAAAAGVRGRGALRPRLLARRRRRRQRGGWTRGGGARRRPGSAAACC